MVGKHKKGVALHKTARGLPFTRRLYMIFPFFPLRDQDLRNEINDNNKLTVGAEIVGNE